MNKTTNKRTHNTLSHSAKGPWNKSLNFIFPIKYVIPKSLKVGHSLSELNYIFLYIRSIFVGFYSTWIAQFFPVRCWTSRGPRSSTPPPRSPMKAFLPYPWTSVGGHWTVIQGTIGTGGGPVHVRVLPWYLAGVQPWDSWGSLTHKYPIYRAYIGISHRGTLVVGRGTSHYLLSHGECSRKLKVWPSEPLAKRTDMYPIPLF